MQKKNPASKEIVKISSLTAIVNAHANPPRERYHEELSQAKIPLMTLPCQRHWTKSIIEPMALMNLAATLRNSIRKKIMKITQRKERSPLFPYIPSSSNPPSWEHLSLKTYTCPISQSFSGHQFGSTCLLHHPMQPMPCLMCSITSSLKWKMLINGSQSFPTTYWKMAH